MSYEDRDVCFAPVFGARSFIICFLLDITIVPVLLTILLGLYPIVFLLTLGRGKPKEEVSMDILSASASVDVEAGKEIPSAELAAFIATGKKIMGRR